MGRLRRLGLVRQTVVIVVNLEEIRKKEEERVRRLTVLEGLLRNWQFWRAVLEDSGVETLVIDGEEWNFHDMLDGIKELPTPQRQALWMILIEDKRPVDAARVIFAGYKRIVGEMAVQYKDDALNKLLAWHYQKKEG